MSIASSGRIVLGVKIAYTAFMAVMIPVYLKNYGPTNFLYFCDVAAVMTLIAIWLESPLLLSAALVGAFLPQMLWVVDYFFELASWLGVGGPEGVHLTGMTRYMFNADNPFFLRFLSFFHFWLVFLLLYLVWCVGYDRRGLVLWMVIAWVLLTVCYVWMPPCSPVKDATTGMLLRDPNHPVNINYVCNIASDDEPQTWMHPDVYFATYLACLTGIYLATHALCCGIMPPRRPT